jgi:hypothetical protein
VAAAGLRLTAADPDTTIAHIDVWADPNTGVPLQVEVIGRDAGSPILSSRFLEVDQRQPDPAVVRPDMADSAGFTVASAEDLANAASNIAPIVLPATLAGRPRTAVPLPGADAIGVGAYGGGLTTFVVLAVPGRTGTQALNGLRDKGGSPVLFSHGQGYEIRSSLISALVVRSDGDRRLRRTFLLAGTVSTDVLRQAATDLLAGSPQ